MINMRIIDRPGFTIVGKQTWIDGPDNEQFGRFWEQCKGDGSLDTLSRLRQGAGQQTNSAVLGVSRVEADPSKRDFFYMISVEVPDGAPFLEDLSVYQVPAGRWAVFECHGAMPDALVASEMYAFGEWLPNSEYQHALAPEMEVYPPTDEPYCEFWLPISPKVASC